jgi:hypothetical protein
MVLAGLLTSAASLRCWASWASSPSWLVPSLGYVLLGLGGLLVLLGPT